MQNLYQLAFFVSPAIPASLRSAMGAASNHGIRLLFFQELKQTIRVLRTIRNDIRSLQFQRL
ncbi:hypothetical protein [Paenibacillus campi]|uniref:hypothetical protein n=1 Tax=Paenibacillus campi TaxID=3106031 RepID=UPI002AFFF1A9|nr:hypothetical protein [Paenibacillus sp. SGZ-1009]